MKEIIIDLHNMEWISKYTGDIKKREVLFCILESREFRIYNRTRSYKSLTKFEYKYPNLSYVSTEVNGYSSNISDRKFAIIFTDTSLIYIFSQKYLF